jgi:glycosyltransferase involved in cell wall biosynthesis
MHIFNVGSKSIHVSKYINALCSLTSHEVSILCEEKTNFCKNEYILSFRSLNFFVWILNYFRLQTILRRVNPDCIHIHQINRVAFVVMLVAKKLQIPVVATAWGSDVLLIPKKNRIYYNLVKYVLHHANVITADSSEMISVMNNIYLDENKYRWIQYGINEISSIKKKDIIFSNRLHKSLYRIDDIIKYFAYFSSSHPSFKLIIAGTGTETENLKKLVDSLGLNPKVEFVGWLDEAQNSSFYSSSLIYISIPQSDGTSVSVLEAMLGGCIPVLPDLSVSKEWVEDGVNGVIEKSVSNPLEEVLQLDFEQVRMYNKKLVSEKALRINTIPQFDAIYREITNI